MSEVKEAEGVSPKSFIIEVNRRNKNIRSIELAWKDSQKTAELISNLLKEESGFLSLPVESVHGKVIRTVFLSSEYLKDSVVTMECVYEDEKYRG